MQKLILAAYVLTTTLALIVLKLGTASGPPMSIVNSKLHFNVNIYTVGGIVLYGISFLTYIYLISKFDLGYIIPVAAAFVYILIFVASYFIFKEVFTATKILGITLIVVGLIIMNLKK
jgi:drug/metabolite transporter (DMT)-like permease